MAFAALALTCSETIRAYWFINLVTFVSLAPHYARASTSGVHDAALAVQEAVDKAFSGVCPSALSNASNVWRDVFAAIRDTPAFVQKLWQRVPFVVLIPQATPASAHVQEPILTFDDIRREVIAGSPQLNESHLLTSCSQLGKRIACSMADLSMPVEKMHEIGLARGNKRARRWQGFQDPMTTSGRLQQLFDQASIFTNGIDRVFSAVGRVCAAVQEVFGVQAAANAYVTKLELDDRIAPHSDRQDTFVLQVAGSRRWRVFQPRAPPPGVNPLERGKLHDVVGDDELRDIMFAEDLKPGQLLHVPIGFIHSTSAPADVGNQDGDHSLHVTFNLETHVLRDNLLSMRECFYRRRNAQPQLALFDMPQHVYRGLLQNPYDSIRQTAWTCPSGDPFDEDVWNAFFMSESSQRAHWNVTERLRRAIVDAMPYGVPSTADLDDIKTTEALESIVSAVMAHRCASMRLSWQRSQRQEMGDVSSELRYIAMSLDRFCSGSQSNEQASSVPVQVASPGRIASSDTAFDARDWLTGSGCCAHPTGSLLDCVRELAEKESTRERDGPRLLVVTAVTPQVAPYCRYSAAVNAAWAKRFGHAFVLDTDARESENIKVLNMMLGATRAALKNAPANVEWVLRIDCDAVLANFREDLLSRYTVAHPHAHVLISRAEGQGVQIASMANFGVVMFRNTDFVARLLDEMWTNKYLRTGGIDQDLFTLMLQADWNGLSSKTVILPDAAMNSVVVAITAPPVEQPIYHLWGHSDDVRETVLREAHSQTCSGQTLLDLNATYVAALVESASTAQASLRSGQPAGEGDLPSRAWRLAAVLEHWGDNARAEHWLRSGLRAAMSWRASGYDPTMWDKSKALSARTSLYRLLESQLRASEAEGVAADAVSSCDTEVRQGESWLLSTCGRVQASLGNVLLLQSRPQEAEAHLRAAWQKLHSTLGPEALETARAVQSLTTALRDRGRATGESADWLRAAINAVSKAMPTSHSEHLVFRANLGLLLESIGQRAEAEHEFKAVLTGWDSLKALQWQTLLDPRALLKALAAGTGSPYGGSRGVKLLETMAHHLDVNNDRDALRWRAHLGEALMHTGRLQEARANIQQALVRGRDKGLLTNVEITALEVDLARLQW